MPLEQSLHERETLLNEAERLAHLGSWVWDMASDAVQWSAELYRIFGIDTLQAPTSQAFYAAVHPEDVDHVRAAAARTVASHVPEPLDFRVVRPDGATRHVHMECAFLEGVRMVGTILDVTERVTMERRLHDAHKMEALGALAGGVAHDFNNYLHVVLGNVEYLLKRVEKGSETEECLVQIREAASRGEHLTRQLLLFGRRRLPDPEVLSIEAMLDAAMPMIGTLVGDHVRVRRVKATSDARVNIAPGVIEQVVLNLVLNARDAMPDGGRVTIDVDTVSLHDDVPGAGESALADGRYVVLAVEDEGNGIPPDVLPHIFEPFYTTKSPGRGTGLGLATAQGLITHAGGTIRAETTLGRGTTFRVLLPLVRPLRSPTRRKPRTTARCAILVVDDQADVRRLIRLVLEEERFEVLEAEDGAEALRTLGLRPDVRLVLCDLSMPAMSGPELMTRLARERSELPVVLMGGVVDSSAAGLSERVLTKPFRRNDLLAAIDHALAPPAKTA